MPRQSTGRHFDAADFVAVAAGAVLGVAIGFIAGGSIGRVNRERIRRVVDRFRPRRAETEVWTEELAERLEARVLDALARDVVLARRRIKVAILGMGLIELTGTVLHTPEIGAASDTVQAVDGVRTVLNHLVVEAPGRPVAPVDGPGTPRAARG